MLSNNPESDGTDIDGLDTPFLPKAAPSSTLHSIGHQLFLSIPLMLINISYSMNGFAAIQLLSTFEDKETLLPAYDVVLYTEALTTAAFIIFIELINIPLGLRQGYFDASAKTPEDRNKRNQAFAVYSQVGYLAGIIPGLLMATALPAFLNALHTKPAYLPFASQYFLVRGATYFLQTAFLAKRQLAYVLHRVWAAALATLFSAGVLYGCGRALLLSEYLTKNPGTLVAAAVALKDVFQFLFYDLLLRVKHGDVYANGYALHLKPLIKIGKELLSFGLPFITTPVCYWLATFVRSQIFNHMDSSVLTIDLIASKYLATVYGLTKGLTIVCSVQSSRLIGAKKFTEIKGILRHATWVVAVLNVAWLLTALFVPAENLMHVFVDDLKMDHAKFKRYLLLSSISACVDGLLNPLFGLLSALRDTKVLSLISSLAPLLSVSIGYGLSKPLGIDGMAIGFAIGSVMAATALLWRTHSQHKMLFTSPSGYATLFAQRHPDVNALSSQQTKEVGGYIPPIDLDNNNPPSNASC
jgi:Na+-driven multidrug efflux pump